jgi:predicted site-specific integrase-resolvase
MQSVPSDRAVISAEEAFDFLGIDRTTGYRAIKDDRFPVPVIRVGRLIKVPTAPLARMLGGNTGLEPTAAVSA